MFGGLSSPAIDAVLTMWPSNPGSACAAASIIGVKQRMPCTTPIRFTPSTHSQSFNVFSQIRPPHATPALLNTKCGTPKRACVAAASACTCSAWDTSTRDASTAAPIASISIRACSSASCCTSAITTCMPSRAAMRDVSRPKPEAAPVITAVRPLKLFMPGPAPSPGSRCAGSARAACPRARRGVRLRPRCRPSRPSCPRRGQRRSRSRIP